MTAFRFTGQCLTLEQYRQMEADGLINRPITDGPIGSDPTRRDADATASALHTEPDTPIPTHLYDRPRKDTAA